MGEFDSLHLPDILQIINADNFSQMQNQADAWQGLSYLLDSQYKRLQDATTALAAGWSSSAGAAFVAQVGQIQSSLLANRDVALSNSTSWSNVVSMAKAAYEEIYRIDGEFQTTIGKAQTDYAKKEADANNSWLNNPVTGGLVDHPDKPVEATIREPFDQRARAVLQVASDTYQQTYGTLQYAAPYTGPTGAYDPLLGTDGKKTSGGTGSGPTDTVTVPPLATPIWDPPFPSDPPVTTDPPTTTDPPSGPGLAGTVTPTPLPPTSPGITAPPLTGPTPPTGPSVFPGLFPTPLPTTGLPISRFPGGKSSLLPELTEPGEPVIGSRGGPRPSLRGPVEGEGPIGSRGMRPGRGVAGEPGEGMPRGGRPTVRSGPGRSVIGRETPTGGRTRGTARSASGEAEEDGVVRPGRRGAQGEAARNTSGQRGRKRRDEDEDQHEQGDGTELWEVNEGGTAVIEPPAQYDASQDRPGPHVGRGGERRR